MIVILDLTFLSIREYLFPQLFTYPHTEPGFVLLLFNQLKSFANKMLPLDLYDSYFQE